MNYLSNLQKSANFYNKCCHICRGANKIITRPCLSALQKLYCVLDCTEICKDILDFSHCGDDYPPVKET